MSVVFISYSREDKLFVAQLREAFLQKAQDIWIDWESIPASKSWWDEIKHGIATANNFVVVMSPNSMSSPICHMEIEEARRLGKRIIPVFHADYTREDCLANISKRLSKPDSKEDITRELWGNRQAYTLFDENQKTLAPINYFFFKPTDDFAQKFDALLDIILTDFDHKEIQTRIGLRAGQWASRDHDVSFLLVGEELKDAEKWLTEAVEKGKNPPPTDLQTNYIRASRDDEDMRHRRLQAIRRARLVATVLAGVMLLFAVGASLVGINAINNATIATTREFLANEQSTSAFGDAATAQAQVGTANVQLNMASIQLDMANVQLATATQILVTGTAVAQSLADAEATLEVVNQQVIYAQATVTQAAEIQDIVSIFANTILQNPNNPQIQISEMNELVELYPDEARAYQVRGLVYAELGNHEEAIANYTQAIELNPDIADFYNNRGNSYTNLGEHEQAIADFERAIFLNPNDETFYLNLGVVYSRLGADEKAIDNYQQALDIYPFDALIHFNLGEAYRNLGEIDRAINSYTDAIIFEPNMLEAYSNRGALYRDLGENDKAIADYNMALSINPNLPIVYYNRGLVYGRLGNQEQAIADFDQSILLDDQSSNTYVARGLSYGILGDNKQANADFTQAIALNPNNATAYYMRATTYACEQAITDYTQAINISPDYEKAYLNRAFCHRELWQTESALADFTRVLELNPQNIEAYRGRANIYWILDNHQAEIDDWTRVIELEPQNETAYYSRGVAYRDLDQYDESIEDLTQAIALNPQNPQAYIERATTYFFLFNQSTDTSTFMQRAQAIVDDYRMAESLGYEIPPAIGELVNELDTMVKNFVPTPTFISPTINPETARNYALMGNRQYDNGQYERAIDFYNQALEANPEYGRAYANRGRAYYQLAQATTDMVLKLDYAQRGVDDFRMAEALGVDFDEETRQFWAELEGLLAENTPTPTP